MRIRNATHYQTRDIAAFVRRAAKDVFMPDEWKRKRKYMEVRVVYARSREVSGCARLGGFRMTLRLHKTHVDRVSFAHLCVHELGHSLGLTHAKMGHGRSPRWSWVGNWRELSGWGDSLPLRTVAPAVKAKPTTAQRREARLVSLHAKLDKWNRAAKLAATKVKKYKSAIRRTESAIMKAATAAPPGDDHE